MSTFLLDTNVVVKAIKGREPVLVRNIAKAIGEGHELALSVISLYELQVGVFRNANRQTAARKLALFLQLVSHNRGFESEDALLAAEVRAGLMEQGRIIGHYDVLIAAQALRRSETVVTNNVSEFSCVPGLRWEDWTLV
jgi:tRNA(fMet)-specific endonuclease VapC